MLLPGPGPYGSILNMGPRYSLWIVLAGVLAGLLVGFLAGRGLMGPRGPRSPAASSKSPSDLPEGEKDSHLAWQVKLHLVSPGRGPGLIISPAELGSEFPCITMNCDNSPRIYPSNRLKESRKVSVIRERECGINTKAVGSVFV